jgi:agmatinase
VTIGEIRAMNLDGLQPWGGLGGASLHGADVVVAGIAYDGSASYRRGAAQAPAEIRRLSAVMPPVTESGTALIELGLHDLGDLRADQGMEAGWRGIADRLAEIAPDSLLTVVGGDHCSAIPVLAAQKRRHPDLHVLWIDAHPDLNASSRGGTWTCGCALRRSLEAGAIEPAHAVLAGCRDFDLDELEYIGEHRMLMLPVGRVVTDPHAAGEAIADHIDGAPVHVSFDIDALDPAFAPGTEIASAGGLSTRDALALLAAVGARCRLVGLDVMEVAPRLDHADITSLAALKLIFEFWGMVSGSTSASRRL